jgi:hypothetical protein
MNKFQKRLKKLQKHNENALVVGQGFGHLNEILEIYKTVFVINEAHPEIKARNLIYRNNFDDISHMVELTVIIVDLDKVDHLDKLTQLWIRSKSSIVIEGNDPIDRSKSKSLYNTNWQCIDLCGFFHVWEKIK